MSYGNTQIGGATALENMKNNGFGKQVGTAATIAQKDKGAEDFMNIPFQNMIGGPLSACIDSQLDSSIHLIDFINRVGFDQEGNCINVEFAFDKPSSIGIPTKKKLVVPLLTMVPIPCLRLDLIEIDFMCKISTLQREKNNLNETNIASGTTQEMDFKAKNYLGFSSTNISTTAVARKSLSNGTQISRDFTMKVKVKAVQDEIPRGLERLLQVLDAQIKESMVPPPGDKEGSVGLPGAGEANAMGATNGAAN